MSWARKMIDKRKLNKVLVRCKNTRHEDKRQRALTKNELAQAKNFRVALDD